VFRVDNLNNLTRYSGKSSIFARNQQIRKERAFVDKKIRGRSVKETNERFVGAALPGQVHLNSQNKSHSRQTGNVTDELRLKGKGSERTLKNSLSAKDIFSETTNLTQSLGEKVLARLPSTGKGKLGLCAILYLRLAQ